MCVNSLFQSIIAKMRGGLVFFEGDGVVVVFSFENLKNKKLLPG